MKLSKRETEVLEILVRRGPMNQKELASALKIKKSNLSSYIKKLDYLGLVESTKKGVEKTIQASQIIMNESAKIENPNVQRVAFSSLVGINPYLISYFYKFVTGFTVKETDLSPATAKRTLKKLRNLGIITMKKRGTYTIRDEMKPLADFCKEILYSIHIYPAQQEAKSLIHSKIDQMPTKLAILFTSKNTFKSRNYFPTAYDTFSKYGIKLLLIEKHYYCNYNPKIEDIVVHTLAFIVGKDVRGTAYSCALIIKKKVSFGKLKKVKYRFGITDQFLDDLKKFIQSKGEIAFKGFPSWNYVEEIAYGKAIR